jgi:dihydroorotate dehydrogenase
VLGDMYALTGGRLPLIGAGGIGSARDAYAKIRAGASLLQLYSALVFRGPALIAEIRTGLAALLRRDGFTRLSDAVGTDRPNPDQS